MVHVIWCRCRFLGTTESRHSFVEVRKHMFGQTLQY